MHPLRLLRLGLRTSRAGLRRKLRGPNRYEGDAAEICEQVIEACFDARRCILLTSRTSYPEIWARDFGRSAPALVTVGRESEVGDTYRHALGVYERAGRFALIIDPADRLLDFPAYAPDGLAFFLHGLAALGDAALVRRHRGFLAREIDRFYSLVVDPDTGLVRRGVHLSEARDYVIRDSSCYSNCACLVLQRAMRALDLDGPLLDIDYADLVERHFWDGERYRDDMSGDPRASGDANVLPLWGGAVARDEAGRARLAKVLDRLDADGLNDPYPTRYGNSPARETESIFIERFNPWQRDTVWTCLGLHLLEVLRDFEHPRLAAELARYVELVERTGCFPELLDVDGELFCGPVYMSEDTMIWASNLLALLRGAGSSGV
jgi:hypothetical protein